MIDETPMIWDEEKPKRKPKNAPASRYFRRGVVGVMVLALIAPLLVFNRSSVGRDEMLDTLIIGYMLCVVVFMAYQVMIRLLSEE